MTTRRYVVRGIHIWDTRANVPVGVGEDAEYAEMIALALNLTEEGEES